LEQDFTADAPNQRWVGDITYLQTSEGFEYLATVIDLYSRRVVGWACAPSLETTIIIQAMDMALRQRQPPPGLIFHSDRGCQYTSQAFRDRLRLAEIRQSMSKTGCCYDNAVAESFFHSLKVEWIHGHELRDRACMRTEVFRYIEGYYNHSRRHSTLGYLTPAEFEQRTQEVA
jgi:transposase InsO family protein